MSEWVLDKAGAISIELVLDRLQNFRSLRGRLFDDFVAVWEIDVQAYGRPAPALGPAIAHGEIFVCQHEARVADLKFGMADLAVRAIHAHDYRRPENVLVIIDRLRGALDDEVWRNVVDFAHHDSPRVFAHRVPVIHTSCAGTR